MNDTQKIGTACFVGGALCVLVALLVAPVFWWLGMVAGAAGGYVAYDIRETARVFIIAFRSSEFGKWLLKPHPFLLFALVVGGVFYYFIAKNPETLTEALQRPNPLAIVRGLTIVLVGFHTLGLFVTSLIMFVIISIPTAIGSFKEKVYWNEHYYKEVINSENNPKLMGWQPIKLTFTNTLRLWMRGVGEILRFALWTWWTFLLVQVAKLVWHFIVLIHSHKRVLCTLDGALGGTAVYLLLAQPDMPIRQQAMLVAFGGILGAALGIANWEFVSKRWFKIA